MEEEAVKRSPTAGETLLFPASGSQPPVEPQPRTEPQAASRMTSATETPREEPFPYRDYVSARSVLEATVQEAPFYGLLTGPSGSGKTSLLHEIEDGLDRHRHQVLRLSSSLASAVGTIRFLAQALFVRPSRTHVETLKVASDAIRAQPAHIVLWIDDADELPIKTLTEVRLFAEYAVPQLFSVVLTGLPELRTTLDQRALFPLKRRISVRLSLEGLRRDELDPFLAHRLGAEAARRVPADLGDELFERTSGIPALAGRVARHALALSGGGPVSQEHLRRAFDAYGL